VSHPVNPTLCDANSGLAVRRFETRKRKITTFTMKRETSTCRDELSLFCYNASLIAEFVHEVPFKKGPPFCKDKLIGMLIIYITL
jgi:hypothetical protein